MLTCSNCNHEQESGKFCEACGQPMYVDVDQAESQQTVAASTETRPNQPNPATEQTLQPNQNVETAKKALKQYWGYFLDLLKNPSTAFTVNESYLLNGVITIALYMVLFSLGVYFYANSIFKSFGSFFMSDSSLPFTIVLQLIIFILIILAVAFFSAFAMIKIGNHQDSIKLLLAQFGSLLVPFTLLNAIAFLGGIIGSGQLIMIPISISLLFSIVFVPVLFVYEKVATINQHGQKVYLSLATVIIMSIIFYILGDALLSSLLEDLDRVLGYIF
ncbi:zinc ribbon domain-containing protein [Lentibacillus sp. Marseille-P4043]|uniref:zinc ribbon domain-containing protein n=1 Tax=Lentibacillus sp. Marseille-P4043 TaxID=2040293 RepID=UPI000D0ABB23|nr:zinc ribbon domain-containing protein [Lentibacillus sp. Marseille-P4043]